MKRAILIIIAVLLVLPCFVQGQPLPESYVLVAAKKDDKQSTDHGGKVVIKGKGGKVTDVDKKPPKKKSNSK